MENAVTRAVQIALPIGDRDINQRVGFYDGNTPCCFGAHLADILGVAKGTEKDFYTGIKAWSTMMGGSTAHAITMLRQAGASDDPLGGETWDVDSVLDKLQSVEELPSLVNANFHGMRFINENLSDVNLENVNFSYCNFEKSVDFTHSNLKGAKFERAVLYGAKTHGAYLEGANFNRTYIYKSDFRGAVLDGIDFGNVAVCKDTLFDDNITPPVVNFVPPQQSW